MNKRKRKKPLSTVILVNRRAFLSVVSLTSTIMQVMSQEFESFRDSGEMDLEVRKALMQVTHAHLSNMSALSEALNVSVFDPSDLDGMKVPDPN